jgi:hypothetical protein
VSHYGANLPAQSAAGADAITVLDGVETTDDNESFVAAARLIPPAGFTTVTGVATNNATISVRLLRAGSVLGTLASVQLVVGKNLVAETPLAMTLTAPQTLVPREGDVIDCLMHQNGTGIAIGANVKVEVELG